MAKIKSLEDALNDIEQIQNEIVGDDQEDSPSERKLSLVNSKSTTSTDVLNDEERKKRDKAREKAEKKGFGIHNTSKSALQSSARERLERYIKSAPQYKLLTQQIGIISQEIKEYKQLGNKDAAELLENKLRELKSQQKKFIDVYSPKTKEEIEEINEKVRNSEELKTMRTELSKHDSIARILSPNKLFSMIYKLLKIVGENDLKNFDSDNEDIEDIEDILSDDVQFDLNIDNIDNIDFSNYEVLEKLGRSVSSAKSYDDAKKQLNLIWNYIAYKCDMTPNEVMEMYHDNTSQLKRIYSDSLSDVDKLKVKTYSNDRRNLMNQINAEENRIKGYDIASTVMFDIFEYSDDKETVIDMMRNVVPTTQQEVLEKFATIIINDIYFGDKHLVTLDYRKNKDKFDALNKVLDIVLDNFKYKNKEIRNTIKNNLFDIFDKMIEEEQKPKDMLSSSYIKYVEAIAYNICSKLNRLQFLQDAISYGLYGLTLVVNNWYKNQKENRKFGMSVSGPYIAQTISMTIRRGLFELTFGGTMTGSAAASKLHYSKERVKFLKDNPEFAGLSEELLDELQDLKELPKITTESEYNSTVEGDEGKGAAFGNIKTDSNEDTFAENVQLYKDLIYTIKEFMKLNEIREIKDKKTGKVHLEKGSNPMFKPEDYKLFKMMYGLEEKYDPDAEGNKKYRPYTQKERGEELTKFLALRGKKQTFSQPAISDKEKKINEKIQKLLKFYPRMKKALQYLAYRISQNQEAISQISKSREELGINYDIPEFDGRIVIQGMSGMSLSQLVETDDVNALEAEISENLIKAIN